MNKRFEAQTRFTFEVYDEFIRFHIRLRLRRLRVLCFAVGAALLAGAGVLLQRGPESPVSLVVCAVLGAALLLAALLPPAVGRRQLRQAAEQMKGKSTVITFYEDRLVSQSGEDRTELRYDQIAECYETADCFYLYPTPSNAYIVVKEALGGGQTEPFRAFLEQKTEGRLHRMD